MHEGHEIRWVYLRRTKLEEIKKIILQFLDDPLKKRVVIDCLAVFWLEDHTTMNEVMTDMRAIVAKMNSVFVHTLVFSSELFPPALQKKWPHIASWNLYCRNLNIQMDMAPLGAHKSLLRKVKNLSKQVCRGEMWAEFKSGAGLGSTLSPEGIDKLTRWHAVHLLNGMNKKVDHGTPLTVNENEPEILSYTPGYKSPTMVAHLKKLGIYLAKPDGKGFKSWKKPYFNKNKGSNRNDYLRPNLSSLDRRSSTASNSTAKSVFSYARSGWRGEGDLADQVKLARVESDNRDLQNVVATLREEKEKDGRKGRDREENLTNTIHRLFNEMEWYIKDRTELASKLIKAEQTLQQVKEDRDALSDENRRINKRKDD